MADGDEVPVGVEAVHLDEPVLVWRPAEHDEEREVAVVLQLRPLAELHRVFDRKRMKPEELAQTPEVLRRGVDEVEPEEIAGVESLADRVAADRFDDAAVALDECGHSQRRQRKKLTIPTTTTISVATTTQKAVVPPSPGKMTFIPKIPTMTESGSIVALKMVSTRRTSF